MLQRFVRPKFLPRKLGVNTDGRADKRRFRKDLGKLFLTGRRTAERQPCTGSIRSESIAPKSSMVQIDLLL